MTPPHTSGTAGTTDDTVTAREPRLPRLLGSLAQALVLGTFLAFALLRLFAQLGGYVGFRYEGF